MVAVDPDRVAVLTSSPDDHRVARHRHRGAKQVVLPGISRLQVGLLRPLCPVAREDIGRSRVEGRIVRQISPDDHRVARNRHREAELVARRGIPCLQVGLLRPHSPATREEVGRAGVRARIVRRVAVDPGCFAVLAGSPDDHRVARHRHREAKVVGLAGVASPGVARLQVGLLRDGIDGKRIPRTRILHHQAHVLFPCRLEARGQDVSVRIPHLQPAVIQHRCPGIIAEMHRLPIR